MNPTHEVESQAQYRQQMQSRPQITDSGMMQQMTSSSSNAQQMLANAAAQQMRQQQQENLLASVPGAAVGQMVAGGNYAAAGRNSSYALQMSGPPSSTQYISSVNPYAGMQASAGAAGSYAVGNAGQTYMASPASYSVSAQQYTSSGNLLPAQQQQYVAGSTTTSQHQYGSGRQMMSGMATTTSSSQQAMAAAGMMTGGMTGQASYMSGGERYKSETRVIGHEYGEERVISVTQRVDESRSHIVNERYVEHEVRVPKRIVREEIIEKVIVVPEKVLQEEIIEEMAKVQEKIVEYAKPIIVEKVVEQVEYEIVEKIIEVPEIVKQDRPVYVDQVVQEERIIEVPKIIPVEKPYDVPEIQYRDVPYERVVEVPEWRDEVVVKQVPVPQYVDEPVPNVVPVEKIVEIERNIPIPVEANITYEFRIPKIKPRYHKIHYPVYLPRFIEVPVALELLQGGLLQQTEMYLQKVGALTKAAASLCEVENLATTIMNADIQTKISTLDLQSFIMKSWKEGSLNVGGMIGRGAMQTGVGASNYSFAATTNAGPMMTSGALRVV